MIYFTTLSKTPGIGLQVLCCFHFLCVWLQEQSWRTTDKSFIGRSMMKNITQPCMDSLSIEPLISPLMLTVFAAVMCTMVITSSTLFLAF